MYGGLLTTDLTPEQLDHFIETFVLKGVKRTDELNFGSHKRYVDTFAFQDLGVQLVIDIDHYDPAVPGFLDGRNQRLGVSKAYQQAHSADFDLVSNGIKNETDTAGQIDIINQMIIAKVDALVIAPADSKALVSAIKKASDRGIVVVNIDNQLDPQVLKSKGLDVPFVGPNNRLGAREVGEYLATRLQAGDEVGIIEGVSTTTNAQMRTAGFKDAMSAAGMKIVPVQSGNWEIDGGNKVAAGMLSEYPNLKAILAGNDSMGFIASMLS